MLTHIEEELGSHPSLKRKRSECPSLTLQAPMALEAEKAT
jgi:hypothetical protein